MIKKYTHLFFDLDNTLWDFKTNSLHALRETFSEFGLNKKSVRFEHFFDVYSVHNHQLWEDYRNKKVRKAELTHQRFQRTFDELGITGIDADEMNRYYLIEMPKQNHLEDGTLELLNYLQARRYKLFIITNGFKEVQLKKMHNSGLQAYFDKVFISEEVKAPKPDPLIFEHALKSTNAKKSCSLMLGDDWNVDIKGALNFGMDAVYYCPNTPSPDYAEYRRSSAKLFSISALSEILLIL